MDYSKCDLYKRYLTKFSKSQVSINNSYPVNVSPHMGYLGLLDMEEAISNVSNQFIKPIDLTVKNIIFILDFHNPPTLTKVQEKWTSTLFFLPDNTWKLFKRLKVQKKIKEFFYKLYNNALPTMNNLKFLNKKCPMCLEHEETITHLLYSCQQTSKHILQFQNILSNVTESTQTFSESEWFNGTTNTLYINSLILLAKWSIWLLRCQISFNTQGPSFWCIFLFEVQKLQQTYKSISTHIFHKLQNYKCI